MKKIIELLILGLLINSAIFAQTVTKSVNGTVTGAACPEIGIQYEVSLPTGFGGCQIIWTVTNGLVQSQSGNTVIIKWNDTPGAKAKLKATFSNCGSGNEANNGKVSNEFEELILSVKNKDWASIPNSIPVNFCNPVSVVITMPEMVVEGTGGFNQPPRQEVGYAWTLPDGWKDLTTGNTGEFGTTTRSITIVPTECAEPGIVKVKGGIGGADGFCGSAAFSKIASIPLTAVEPLVTVFPPSGYTGSTACNITPVTFTAVVTNAPGCAITSYEWTHTASWTFESQSGNTITLRPKGELSDASEISCKVTFGCGSDRSGALTPTFIQSTLTGPSVVCYSGSQFALNDVPAGASVTWTAQPANLFSVSSGNFTGNGGTHNILLAAASSITSGSGTITASINAGCGNPIQIQQTFWTGTAQIQNISYPSSMVVPNQLIPLSIETYPGSSNGYYKAEISRKFGGYNHTTYGNVIEFSLPMTGTFNVKVYADNACGWPQNFYPLVFFCAEGGGMFAVHPNPADNYVDIEMVDNDGKITEAETESYQVTLVDDTGTEKLKTSIREKKKRIDTSQLRTGQYILHIRYKGEVTLQRIIIDR